MLLGRRFGKLKLYDSSDLVRSLFRQIDRKLIARLLESTFLFAGQQRSCGDLVRHPRELKDSIFRPLKNVKVQLARPCGKSVSPLDLHNGFPLLVLFSFIDRSQLWSKRRGTATVNRLAILLQPLAHL